MSMRSTFRGASAALAAALTLASCGAMSGEVAKPRETPSAAADTTTASPTQIPSAETSAEASGEPSESPEASDSASESPSESPSGDPSESPKTDAKVTEAPTVIAQFTGEEFPEIGDFPFAKDTIADSIASVFEDGGDVSVECDGDVDITAGKPKTHCTVKGEEKATEAFVYGTFSNVQGPGFLVAFDKDFDSSLTARFTEPGTEVLAYGMGGTWAADAPVDGAHVSKKALRVMEAFEMPVSKFECTGEVFIPEGRNSQVCPIEAEWGKSEATVIAATILNSQDTGVLVVLQTPDED